MFDIPGFEGVGIWFPPLIAFIISSLSSTGGISGAFLILPFQMTFFNFTSPAVSATNHVYNVVAIPGGVYRYIKEGRMVWPLAWVVVCGTLPGVVIGMVARITIFAEVKNFKVFVALVLLYIGWRLISALLKKANKETQGVEERFQQLVQNFRKDNENGNKVDIKKLPRIKIKKFSLKKMIYEFYGETYNIPTIKLFVISFLVGIVGGIYGIGGGAIIAPVYVAFFGLPIYTVGGASLLGTFITSFFSVILFQVCAPFFPGVDMSPNWILGGLFGIGGLAGTYFGAYVQKFIPAKLIKYFLGFIIIFMSVSYILEFFNIKIFEMLKGMF